MDQTFTNDYFQSLELIKNCTAPIFPEYATISKRVQSLNEFSATISDKLLLADAGFFYRTRDSVKCFVCGVILGNWLRGDCPFREHAKYSKKCPFLILSKGTKFVNEVNNIFMYKDSSYFITHSYDEIDSVTYECGDGIDG